jgi:phosphopantetheinyl transferase
LLEALRARTGAVSGWSSKTHSRALAAAALSTSGPVGIDAEFEAPERDICTIASMLADAPVGASAQGYRIFTYYESYFKATGDVPRRELLQVVANASAAFYATPDGLSVLHETPAPHFTLTLVWRGGSAPVRHDLPDEPKRRL